MKLIDLQNKVHDGYAHGEGMGDYYDKETGEPTDFHPGDSLEWFLALEIAETFDKDADDAAQLAEASRVIQSAISDLEGALNAIIKEDK